MRNGLAIITSDAAAEGWTLDRSSPVPLYAQIKQHLLALIATWDRPDERFFTDEQLCGRFGVNRLTVRQAVQSLVEDGFLVRSRGTGTVIRREKIEEHFTPRMNFLEEWAARGFEMRAEALCCETIGAPEAVATALDLPAGAEVVHIRRRRFAREVPVSLDDRFLPLDLGRAIGLADIEATSLLDILRRQTRLHHCDMQIEALTASGEMVPSLKVLPGEALLARRFTYFDDAGRAVMTGQSFHRASLVRYALQIALDTPEGSLETE
jgi:GntR family transcriptional regulator